MDQFLLRVEGDILSALRGFAEEDGVSTSQLMRDILKSYVDSAAKIDTSKVVKKREKEWWL
tara:strand:- start:28 stop:210 length:183 start_codon:yes stop_codon:yes gene_type:complete